MQITKPEPGSHYIDVTSLPWQATRFPGVEMKILWSAPDGAAFTGMFRMAPGAKLPKHSHGGVEQTFMLQGSLVDDAGTCTAGNYVWRDVGSVHTAHSPDGCVMIGIFQEENEFLDDDR